MLCFGFGFGPGFFFSRLGRLWIILIIFFSFFFSLFRIDYWTTNNLVSLFSIFFFFSSFLLTIIFFLLSTDTQHRVLAIIWVSKQKHVFPALLLLSAERDLFFLSMFLSNCEALIYAPLMHIQYFGFRNANCYCGRLCFYTKHVRFLVANCTVPCVKFLTFHAVEMKWEFIIL